MNETVRARQAIGAIVTLLVFLVFGPALALLVFFVIITLFARTNPLPELIDLWSTTGWFSISLYYRTSFLPAAVAALAAIGASAFFRRVHFYLAVFAASAVATGLILAVRATMRGDAVDWPIALLCSVTAGIAALACAAIARPFRFRFRMVGS